MSSWCAINRMMEITRHGSGNSVVTSCTGCIPAFLGCSCFRVMWPACASLGTSQFDFLLWRCWLGGRKGIRPVKNWVVGCCMVICLERGADLHMAQLMPLPPTVSCSSKIQIGFTFLVPAPLGSPGQRAAKRMYVLIKLQCFDAVGWVLACLSVWSKVQTCIWPS